jgi:hypothetical protein
MISCSGDPSIISGVSRFEIGAILDVFRYRLVLTIHMTILDILCHSHNYILDCGIGKNIFDLSIGDSLSS